MNTRKLVLIALLTSLGITLRLMKHLFVGPVQFINFPLVFGLLAGYLFGVRIGFLVGFLTFSISDLIIFPGPWTIVDSSLSALLSGVWGLLKKIDDRILIFILAYLTTFVYDILSSFILYLLIFGVNNAVVALSISILGLFMPVMGGYLYAVGPVTEFTTSFLFTYLVKELKRILKGDRPRWSGWLLS